MDHKESFLRYLETEKRYSPHTLRSYSNDLNQFISYITSYGHTGEPGSVTSHDIRSWMVDLLNNGLTPASVHRKISCLRAFFRYLRKEGFVKNDPLGKLVLPKRKKRLPAFVGEEDLTRLLDAFDFGDDYKGILGRTIIEMLYLTGMRRSELTGLKNDDVDIEGGSVKVTGKRNKQRIVPLLRSFRPRLEEYIKVRNEAVEINTKNWFFVTPAGNKLYDKYVYNIVRNYLSMVTTMEKKSPHILRHTFATHMLNHGADLNSIKELLGHANLSATQVYTHNTFEKLKRIYKQAHPRA